MPQESVRGVDHHEIADFSVLVAAIGISVIFVRVDIEDSRYYA